MKYSANPPPRKRLCPGPPFIFYLGMFWFFLFPDFSKDGYHSPPPLGAQAGLSLLLVRDSPCIWSTPPSCDGGLISLLFYVVCCLIDPGRLRLSFFPRCTIQSRSGPFHKCLFGTPHLTNALLHAFAIAEFQPPQPDAFSPAPHAGKSSSSRRTFPSYEATFSKE